MSAELRRTSEQYDQRIQALEQQKEARENEIGNIEKGIAELKDAKQHIDGIIKSLPPPPKPKIPIPQGT